MLWTCTYASLHGGDFRARDLPELGQLVQDLQCGDDQHDVRQRQEGDDFSVRLLIHILADQNAVILHFAQVPEDFHGCGNN